MASASRNAWISPGARQAEGYQEAANSFFRKAAELEGITLSDAGNTTNPNDGTRTMADRVLATMTPTDTMPLVKVINPHFPTNAQPGSFNPMQPDDADYGIEHYVKNDLYWGQPKIDGNEMIVFAAPEQVWYQSREGNMFEVLDDEMDNALKRLANMNGPFILIGERVYLDVEGREFHTASEASRSNLKKGHPGRLPQVHYCVFACIWRYNDVDLRTYGQMVDLGRGYAEACRNLGSSVIVPINTFKTRQGKENLVRDQVNHSREGMIWFIPSMPYGIGKNAEDNFVRTKFLKELVARATGYTKSPNPDYAFGALCIESLDGEDLGGVGTGFTLEQRRAIKARLDTDGPFLIEVRYQNITVDGKLVHARYLKTAA